MIGKICDGHVMRYIFYAMLSKWFWPRNKKISHDIKKFVVIYLLKNYEKTSSVKMTAVNLIQNIGKKSHRWNRSVVMWFKGVFNFERGAKFYNRYYDDDESYLLLISRLIFINFQSIGTVNKKLGNKIRKT